MKRLVKKHPLAIRWFHWVNFPLLVVMIWSGLLIYWASSDERYVGGIYRVGWNSTTFFHFFPESFWKTLGLQQQLASGMAWHFLFMWIFALNGMAYVLYATFSGEWRHLVPGRHAWSGAWQVVMHDLHLRKTKPVFERYNPAQQIAYCMVVVMGGASLLTGLAIYRPVQVGWLTTLLGGYSWARWEHFWLTIGYVFFFVIHVLQVMRAGWSNFRSMIAGYEIREEPRQT